MRKGEIMSVFKSKWFLLGVAIILGILVLALPRPEGTRFRISGDADQRLLSEIKNNFDVVVWPCLLSSGWC